MPHRYTFALSLVVSLVSCSPRGTNGAADSGRGDTASVRSTDSSPGADSADVLTAERRIWEGLRSDHASLDSLFGGAVDMDPNGITLEFKPGAAAQQLGSCVIKSYAMDSAHVKVLSPDQRLLTYKASYDWACGGQRVPSPAYEMALWQRTGGRWALVAHAASVAFTAR